MRDDVLVVPGFRGSGPGHWQTWLESALPGARRLAGVDWDAPVLAQWSAAIERQTLALDKPAWLVAHSFGCLASVVAAASLPERIAGVLLVAPADPDRFVAAGLRTGTEVETLMGLVPAAPLPCASILAFSRNDPWLGVGKAAYLAQRWGSRPVDLGGAGHVNADAGFGAWPQALELLESLQQQARGRHAAPFDDATTARMPSRDGFVADPRPDVGP